MKRILCALTISLLILVTGCSNTGINLSGNKTLTCTKVETDDDGYKTTDEIKVTYNSSKVLKADIVSTSETDPEYIDLTIGFANLFKTAFDGIEGIKFEAVKAAENKMQSIMNIDYETLDIEKIKEAFGDDSDDEFYSKKDFTIDEFKANYLEEYECK